VICAWAGGSTLPLTSWRDGRFVYVSATPMPLTAAQARAAAQRLLEHADAICGDCDTSPAPCICEIADGTAQ
jgi:hypothetical protein